MFEYELDGEVLQFTQEDVDNRAKEKGLTTEEYLNQHPEVKSVGVEKKEDVATQGAPVTSVNDTASNLVAFSLDSVSSTVALSKLIDENYEEVINIGKFTLQENTDESIKEKPQESQENTTKPKYKDPDVYEKVIKGFNPFFIGKKEKPQESQENKDVKKREKNKKAKLYSFCYDK